MGIESDSSHTNVSKVLLEDLFRASISRLRLETFFCESLMSGVHWRVAGGTICPSWVSTGAHPSLLSAIYHACDHDLRQGRVC